jgi:hypothetical protein
MCERLTTWVGILRLELFSLRFPCPCRVHAEEGEGGRSSSSETLYRLRRESRTVSSCLFSRFLSGHF